jgi:hypothetical protein
MTRIPLLLACLPLLASAQTDPLPEGVRPLNSTSRRAVPDSGRFGSPTRRPLAPELLAPEYPVPYQAKARQQRPAPNSFNGDVSTEVTIGSEFQTPVTSTDLTFTTGDDDVTGTIQGPPRVDPRATLTAPSNGATLGLSATFSWTAGTQATRYWLTVGSCADCADYADRDMALNRSATVNLPSDGRVIYASIYTAFNGAWFWHDYQFRATTANAGAPSELTSPANGSTLTPTQTFTWNSGSNLDYRWLNVGSCGLCGDLFDADIWGRSSVNVGIPQDGRTIFVTVWSFINGDWYIREYQFRAPAAVQTTRLVRVNVTNKLRYTINVSINDRVRGSIPAGETRYVEDTVGSSMTVSWDLERPTLGARALGDTMGGRFSAISNPSGTYNYNVDYIVGDSQFFRPLFTNRSSVALLMEANGGTSAQNRCDCTAAAGTTNVHSGYYRLYSNSNFRVFRSGSNYTGSYLFWGTNSDGRISSGGEIWRNVTAGSGEITFTTSTAP